LKKIPQRLSLQGYLEVYKGKRTSRPWKEFTSGRSSSIRKALESGKSLGYECVNVSYRYLLAHKMQGSERGSRRLQKTEEP
jgi:hypothetical protein